MLDRRARIVTTLSQGEVARDGLVPSTQRAAVAAAEPASAVDTALLRVTARHHVAAEGLPGAWAEAGGAARGLRGACGGGPAADATGGRDLCDRRDDDAGRDGEGALREGLPEVPGEARARASCSVTSSRQGCDVRSDHCTRIMCHS